jgi:hypothetical protein
MEPQLQGVQWLSLTSARRCASADGNWLGKCLLLQLLVVDRYGEEELFDPSVAFDTGGEYQSSRGSVELSYDKRSTGSK